MPVWPGLRAFRALNLAFVNEMAAVTAHHGLDPIEIVDAAATKPYGSRAHLNRRA